jgi:hypothetical protein
MAEKRAAGRHRRVGSALAALLLAGCITRPAPVPWPCDRIDEVPGLHEEMAALHVSDDDRWRMSLPPATERLRAYAKDASVACAANREMGAARITPEVNPLSVGTRIKRWFVRMVAY